MVLLAWFFLKPAFDADSKIECRKIDDGACWAVVSRRIGQFVYGFYPEVERWRIDITFFAMFLHLLLCCIQTYLKENFFYGLVEFFQF